MSLVLPRVRAPEFGAGQWLNSAQPVRMADLRGYVVLVAIWDYTCLNCLRVLPYLTAWHQYWRDLGAVFVGVHTPEFEFARDSRQVEAALQRSGITFPVVLDNEARTWDAFANRYWPTIYLIDHDGYIVYQHSGEGRYHETERALADVVRRALPHIKQRDAPVQLPRPVGALRSEDQPGAVCFRTTPELHAGCHRGALGNPQGYLPRSVPALYSLPPPHERQDGYFYVEGMWRAGQDSLALAGARGTVVLPYRAATVNAVLATSADPVDLILDLKPPVDLRVTQDGRTLDPLTAGADINFDEKQSYVRIDAPRMYELARNPDARPHELRLEADAQGLAVFSFSFSSCVVGTAEPPR
jgi:thiol-disulfide isomerase/thioredoxin